MCNLLPEHVYRRPTKVQRLKNVEEYSDCSSRENLETVVCVCVYFLLFFYSLFMYVFAVYGVCVHTLCEVGTCM